MTHFRNLRLLVPGLILGAVLGFSSGALTQESSARHRSMLLPYVGQEVLVVDTTSGAPQFQNNDALLLYRLTLNAVRRDYIIVSRNIDGDKRAFVYPLASIRRVTTATGGVPLRPILIEMY